MTISAVIVTRGDVDLAPVLHSLPQAWEKIVWDNSQRTDLSVYGRYAAIAECEHELIYVQDDDCVLEPDSIRALVELALNRPSPLQHVIANMPGRFRPHYPDSALIGFGAIFQRDLPERAFEQFKRYHLWDSDKQMTEAEGAEFRRTCDVVFTTLTPRILVDAPYADLPWASGPDRMYRQQTHVGERARMLELARAVRDGVPA